MAPETAVIRRQPLGDASAQHDSAGSGLSMAGGAPWRAGLVARLGARGWWRALARGAGGAPWRAGLVAQLTNAMAGL